MLQFNQLPIHMNLRSWKRGSNLNWWRSSRKRDSKRRKIKRYTSKLGRGIWRSWRSRCERLWRLRMKNFSKYRRNIALKMKRCWGSMRKRWEISRGRRNLLKKNHRRDCRDWSIKNLFNSRSWLILKLELKDMEKVGKSKLKRFKKQKKRLKIKKNRSKRNGKKEYLTLKCKRKKRKINKKKRKMKGKRKKKKMLSKSQNKQKKSNTKSLWLNYKRLNTQNKSKRWNSLRKKSKSLKRNKSQRDSPKHKVLQNCQNNHQK